jgi:hypothetical protein
MAFFELMPVFECSATKDSDTYINWYECENSDFCENLRDPSNVSPIPASRLKPDQDTLLHNWVSQFNLVCATKTTMGLFGSLFFMGVLVGSISIPRLSDVYGRKRVMVLGNIVHIAAGLGMLATSNL